MCYTSLYTFKIQRTSKQLSFKLSRIISGLWFYDITAIFLDDQDVYVGLYFNICKRCGVFERTLDVPLLL